MRNVVRFWRDPHAVLAAGRRHVTPQGLLLLTSTSRPLVADVPRVRVRAFRLT
jgi:hypothetical protein